MLALSYAVMPIFLVSVLFIDLYVLHFKINNYTILFSFLVAACSYAMSIVRLFYLGDCCIRGEFNLHCMLHELKLAKRGVADV